MRAEKVKEKLAKLILPLCWEKIPSKQFETMSVAVVIVVLTTPNIFYPLPHGSLALYS